MKGALGPLLLSLLLLLQPGGCQEVKVVAAVGETVQLQPKTWPSSWVAINWKVKLHSEGYWILQHNQNSTTASPFLPFAARVSFHPGNLSLQINAVTEKESGLYTMDLTLGDGSNVTSSFRLSVLDRVQQPKIKASTSQERGRCYLTLFCSVPKAAGVTYSWSRGVSSSPAPEDHWLQEHQANLQLEITERGNSTFYHCSVSNDISWDIATIDIEPLCNYTEIPFQCQPDLVEDNEYRQKCLNRSHQSLPGGKEDNFCSLRNTTLEIFKASCEKTNSTPPTLKKTATSFDKVLKEISVSQMDKKEVASTATMILEGLSSTAVSAALASSENKTQTVTSQMVIETKRADQYCGSSTNFLRLDAQKDSIDINCTDITDGDGKDSAAVAFISYTSLDSVLGIQFFQEKDLQRKDYARVNSQVVSAASSTQKRNVSNPVILTFHHKTDMFPQDEVICVRWNSEGSTGTWSSQGCECLQSNITHSQCSCSYLTSFAILMSPTPMKANFALSIISYIGLVISLICLVLAIPTFLFSRAVKNTSSNFIHLQLSIFLFLADIIFLAGVNQTFVKLLCSIIAGVLHYLFLACFAWMFMEGVNLFLIVRNLKVANYSGAGRCMKIFMYAFGYGFPSVIVMISAISFPTGYGTPYHCWLRLDRNFKWSFLGPVCTIIVTNFVLFCVTLTILQGHLSSLNTELSTVKNTRLLIFKALAHLFIMGITWMLGLFQFEVLADFMAYLFTIVNSIQGAFIFLVHCLLNRKVREEYWNWCKKCCPCAKGRTSASDVSMSTLPSSAITDVLQKTQPPEQKMVQWE